MSFAPLFLSIVSRGFGVILPCSRQMTKPKKQTVGNSKMGVWEDYLVGGVSPFEKY